MDKSSLPITIGLVLLRYLIGYKHNKSTKIRANGDTSGSVAKKASWYVPESPVPLLIRLQRLRRKAFAHSFSRSESKFCINHISQRRWIMIGIGCQKFYPKKSWIESNRTSWGLTVASWAVSSSRTLSVVVFDEPTSDKNLACCLFMLAEGIVNCQYAGNGIRLTGASAASFARFVRSLKDNF